MLFRLSLKLISSFALIFAAHLAHAQPITQCPTTEELQGFESVFVMPYAYQYANHKMAYMALRGKQIENDNADLVWVMFLNPVYAGQKEDIYNVIKTTLPSLKSVSNTPFEFRPIETDSVNVQFCAYELPGKKGMQALVYAVDLENDESGYIDDPDFKSKIIRHAKVKKIMQQMMMK